MDPISRQHPSQRRVLDIAERQHDRITVAQLLSLGMSHDAIRHRVRTGRLFRVAHGVLAVSRPSGTDEERWMTAVLRGGTRSMLGGADAFALWGLGPSVGPPTHISLIGGGQRTRSGLIVHRRSADLACERRVRRLIPVTSPALTIIDNALRIGTTGVDAAISEADARGYASPRVIHETAKRLCGIPGSGVVNDLLDRRTLVLTHTQLERWFLPLSRRAGLPDPLGQRRSCGFRVDFLWPELGLVVETDGGTYHRTPGQQTRDRRMEQAHLVAGLTFLRFTHEQIRYEREEVLSVLRPVAARLMSRAQ